MVEQKRDASGKFAKKKPENPDCEPATKGYVKCVARKTMKHTHMVDIDNLLTANFVSNSCVCLISFALIIHILDVDLVSVLLCLIGGFVSLMIVISIMWINAEAETSDVNFEVDLHRAIKKHTPPECEKKKEC